MSQSPRSSRPDESLNQYLTGWQATLELLNQGRSWSGRERNTVFLNCQNGPFANISSVSGLDFPDDGRALAMVDWDQDGDLDLWLYNRSGPRLRLMLNHSQTQSGRHNFVAFRLRGTTVNRDAIGARVEVKLKDRSPTRLIQTLYAGDGFLSQSSKWLHFGLGTDPEIQGIVVHWPGGGTEEFSEVRAGRRYILSQGSGKPQEWITPRRTLALAPSIQTQPKISESARIFLPIRFPMPILQQRLFDNPTPRPIQSHAVPLLVNLWGSWCLPCISELKELTERESQLRAVGLSVLALCVDDQNQAQKTKPSDAKRMLDRINFPFDSGIATIELLDKLSLMQKIIFNRPQEPVVPMSLLLDKQGRLAAIYRGRINPDKLINDVGKINASPKELHDLSVPFPGRWYRLLVALDFVEMAEVFERQYPQDVLRFLQLADEQLEASSRQDLQYEKNRQDLDKKTARAHYNLGNSLGSRGKTEEAIGHYKQAVRINPEFAEAHNDLGVELGAQDRLEEAILHFQRGLEVQPNYAEAHNNLGKAFETKGQLEQAIRYYRRALESKPDLAEAHYNIGLALVVGDELEEAMAHYRKALEINPDYIEVHINLGMTMSLDGQLVGALKHYREALRLQPDSIAPLNDLAWILATHPDSSVRKPTEALHLAIKAADLTQYRSAPILDTLAAAYAASGRFTEAVEAAQRALDLLQTAGQKQAAEIRKRLVLYQRKQPYWEPNPGDGNLPDSSLQK